MLNPIEEFTVHDPTPIPWFVEGVVLIPWRFIDGAKRPLVKGWSDPKYVSTPESWWWDHLDDDEVDCGIGLRCDGITVADPDTLEMNAWWKANGQPTPVTVQTKRGRHHYYTGESRRGSPLFGLDIKTGPGSWVAIPPSLRDDGVPYHWVGPPLWESEVPEVDDDLLAGLWPVGSRKKRRRKRWALDLDDLADELAEATEPGRNDCLNTVAFEAFMAGFEFEEVSDVLTDVAVEIGLEDREIEATIQSAWNGALKAEEDE